jgi:glycosyltransferase involved in cell wall biosynthesis
VSTSAAPVTAIVTTYQRADLVERAVASVLAQTLPPLEVLVCDDGSADETPDRMRALEASEPSVRYLRIEPNRGTPAPARNLGLRDARAEWVAFLDDDDEWLPGKLARQLELADSADVIAGNAETDDGLYFRDAPELAMPDRADIVRDNPVIQSSAMVRREHLLRVGGFPEHRWLRGIEDYAAWLRLADDGARFAVLGAPVIRYTRHDAGRLSDQVARTERARARLAWRGALKRPTDPLLWRVAGARTASAAANSIQAWRRSR